MFGYWLRLVLTLLGGCLSTRMIHMYHDRWPGPCFTVRGFSCLRLATASSDYVCARDVPYTLCMRTAVMFKRALCPAAFGNQVQGAGRGTGRKYMTRREGKVACVRDGVVSTPAPRRAALRVRARGMSVGRTSATSFEWFACPCSIALPRHCTAQNSCSRVSGATGHRGRV